MKKNMTFPIRFWGTLLIFLLLYQFSTSVHASDCKYEKKINLELNLSDSQSLSINALAGDLQIKGIKGSKQAIIEGRLCVSRQEWLDESRIELSTGKHAKIDTILPDEDNGWSWSGNQYKYIDLRIKVPSDMPLEVRDSSGDLSMVNVGPVNLQDSSGDIEIDQSSGPVVVRDSSGDIVIEHVANDVTIESDSSGGIELTDIDGNALVERDSSGEIEFRNIQGDATVERDSSGSISARDIGGDFRVDKDGSGSINSSNVKGSVTIPKQK